MSAYVLVSVEPARTQEVLDRLRTIPHAIVREVLGPYDMIVELEADTSENLASVLAMPSATPGVSPTR